MSDADGPHAEVVGKKVRDFDLSVRTQNCCARQGIFTLGDLAQQTERSVLAWRGAGKKTLEQIRTLLAAHDLRLREMGDTPQPEDRPTLKLIELSTADMEVKRKLIVRLADLTSSARVLSFVAKAKLVYMGDLIQLEVSDVLRLPNSGFVTLDAIVELVGGFGLALGTQINGWSAIEAKALEAKLTQEVRADRRARSRQALAEAGSSPACLEDELKRIIQVVEKGRNVDLLLKLWGWSGEEPRTLESVGQEFDLTRERVRQIEAQALKRLAPYRFDLGHVNAALISLRRAAPGPHAQLEKTLQNELIARSGFSISGIEHATKLVKLKWPFENVEINRQRFLVLRSEISHYKGAVTIARRKTSETGCSNLSWVASDAGIGKGAVGSLRALFNVVTGIEWLDQGREWFYFRGARNRLLNTCSKILGVCPRIRLSELRRAAAKSRRLGMAPPQHILAAFVEKTGLGTIKNNIVDANVAMAKAPAPESAEGILLKVLDDHGPVMDGDELAEKCIEAGMNEITFFIYRIGSPVIVSLGRGVYGRVGCEVPPGLVNQIADRKKRTRSLLDSGWNPAGRFWFGVRLSRIVIVGGSILLPSAAKGIIHGRWRVYLPDGTDCGTVESSDQFIWRFRKAFIRLGAEPSDYAAFEFDTKAHRILLRVGGIEVLEATQSAKGSEMTDQEVGEDEVI